MAQLQLLVTASTAPFRDRIESSEDPLALEDMPSFGAGELGVRGLSITTSMLAGASAATLEALRDAGDKARCPMLLLVEDQPLELANPDAGIRAAAIERIGRLSKAAGILGCAQLGVSIESHDAGDGPFELTASTVREAMQRIDRFEVSLLIRSGSGLTADADRLTELIKKIGGFRIGSLPDFRLAHDTGDFAGVLRRLAPYAGTILATVGKSGPGGKKGTGKADPTPYDLVEGLESVLAVGYQHAICLDHVGGRNAVDSIVEARARIEAALAPEVVEEVAEEATGEATVEATGEATGEAAGEIAGEGAEEVTGEATEDKGEDA